MFKRRVLKRINSVKSGKLLKSNFCSQKSRGAHRRLDASGKTSLRFALEAFIMSNNKKNVTTLQSLCATNFEPSTTSSTTTADHSASSGDSRIDPNTQMIIHTVSAKDTLQGLAIKYGVTVSELLLFVAYAVDVWPQKRKQIDDK
jgi:hypothetical protein